MSTAIILTFMLLALLTVISGTIVMTIGGQINKKYANKLMQMRILFQALAVISLYFLYNGN
jgi:hypothetical protein